MQKDFERWHSLKESLNSLILEEDFYYNERELWMCHLGVNIGSEQDGDQELFSRPVLIFKIFNRDVFFGIPITLQAHDEIYHYKFNLGGLDQYAMLSQIRLFSTKRLYRRITRMPRNQYFDLARAFGNLIPKDEILPGGEDFL